MARAFLTLFFVASSLGASIVERVPVTAPVSSVVDAGPGRIVASDAGVFLVHGQRISRDGVPLDDEPVPGANGHATAWSDGWLLIDSRDDQRYISHLRTTGAPESVLQIRAINSFEGAASVSGRLAMLEVDRVGFEDHLWITIIDGREVLRRAMLGRAEGATIVRFDGGFLVVSWERQLDNTRILSAWRLGADGEVLKSRVLEGSSPYIDNLFVAVQGDKAVILTRDWNFAHCRVIDGDLSTTAFLSMDQGRVDTYWTMPLPMEEGFLVSYTRYGSLESGSRAMVVRLDGTVASDTVVEPIAAGDRSGSRYLVARPWGQAAIAEGDPRRIVSSAIVLRRRVFESWTDIETTVSGDVTLVAINRSRFARVEADGTAIDPESQFLPRLYNSVIAAIPNGFAFAWIELGSVRWQRLSRRGGWIDPEPRTLVLTPGAYGVALHANDHDLLVAWTTATETLWSRFDLEGASLQGSPDRVAHAPREEYAGTPSEITIAGRGNERIVRVQDTFMCQILCPPPALGLESFTVDGDGRRLGPLTLVDSFGSSEAVGLTDGTWVFHATTGDGDGSTLLHLARDGSLLSESFVPELSGRITDMLPTESGWTAIVEYPSRLVEVEGAGQVTRVTGLQGSLSARFAAGGRIAFLDRSEGIEGGMIPWTGRVSAIDGDLELRLTDLGRDSRGQHLLVQVRNESHQDATGVYVTSSFGYSLGTDDPHVLGVVRAGEAVQFNAIISAYSQILFALSPDVSDTNPSDNRAVTIEAAPRPQRARPVKR